MANASRVSTEICYAGLALSSVTSACRFQMQRAFWESMAMSGVARCQHGSKMCCTCIFGCALEACMHALSLSVWISDPWLILILDSAQQSQSQPLCLSPFAGSAVCWPASLEVCWHSKSKWHVYRASVTTDSTDHHIVTIVLWEVWVAICFLITWHDSYWVNQSQPSQMVIWWAMFTAYILHHRHRHRHRLVFRGWRSIGAAQISLLFGISHTTSSSRIGRKLSIRNSFLVSFVVTGIGMLGGVAPWPLLFGYVTVVGA